MTNKAKETASHIQVDKRNFLLLTIDGALFRSGFEYVNAFTIVSVFIHTLTGSVMLAGLSQFVQTFFMQLGRFMTAPKIHTIKNQPKFMIKISTLARIMWLVLSIMLFLNASKEIIIPALFVTIAISWYLGGKTWPVFEDLLARTILSRRRSTLLGNREFFGGIAAFAGSFIIKQILSSELSTNYKYGILFSIGFVLLVSVGFVYFKVKDIDYKVDNNYSPLFEVLKNAGTTLKADRNYRWYLIMRCIWIITDSALLWSLIAVKSVGNLSDFIVSYLLIAQIIGRIFGAALWGRVAKKGGSRKTIIIAHIANVLIAISIIMIISQTSVANILYIIICFVVGLSTPAVIVNFVYFSETTHMTNRPRFMTIESAVSMPLAFVSYLFGVIAENFGFIPIYSTLICGSLIIVSIAAFKLLKPHEIDDNVSP